MSDNDPFSAFESDRTVIKPSAGRGGRAASAPAPAGSGNTAAAAMPEAAPLPDLPGVTAAGYTEDEPLHALSRNMRQHLGKLVLSGEALPPSRSVDELPCSRGHRILRRLLLIIG